MQMVISIAASAMIRFFVFNGLFLFIFCHFILHFVQSIYKLFCRCLFWVNERSKSGIFFILSKRTTHVTWYSSCWMCVCAVLYVFVVVKDCWNINKSLAAFITISYPYFHYSHSIIWASLHSFEEKKLYKIRKLWWLLAHPNNTSPQAQELWCEHISNLYIALPSKNAATFAAKFKTQFMLCAI